MSVSPESVVSEKSTSIAGDVKLSVFPRLESTGIAGDVKFSVFPRLESTGIAGDVKFSVFPRLKSTGIAGDVKFSVFPRQCLYSLNKVIIFAPMAAPRFVRNQ